MSGRGSAAPTHIDRLQNHVTGSLLLNMIDNTGKLNKKITSSSSSLSDDLKSLKTKVNQMTSSVTAAADKAKEAAAAAEAAAAEAVVKNPTEAQMISKNLTLSDGVLTILKYGKVNPLLMVDGNIKSTDSITANTIISTGNLNAGNVITGLVSAYELQATSDIRTTEGSIVVENGESSETLQLNMLSDGNARVWSDTPNLILQSNNKLSLEGGKGITLNSSTQMNADMTIGTADDETPKKLTVNGTIESKGDVTIGTSTTGADLTVYGDITAGDITATDFITTGDVSLIDLVNGAVMKQSSSSQTIYSNVIIGSSSPNANLSVNGETQLNGKVTVGLSSTDDNADLNVNGVTKLNGDVTIGKTTNAADLTVHGDITLEPNSSDTIPTLTSQQIVVENISHTSDSSKPLITLGSNDVDIGASDGTTSVTIYGHPTIGTFSTGGGLIVYGGITSTGTLIAHNGIESWGDMEVGDSSNSKTADLSVNGETKLNGKVTVGLSSLDDDADLNVNGVTKLNGNVTIEPSAGVGLTVNGPIMTSASIMIGNLTISYDPETGVVTFTDSTTTPAKSATIQLR